MRDLAIEFFARTTSPRQAQIDVLRNRLGIPVAALSNDPDGAGYMIGVAQVEKAGRRFEFLDDGTRAVVVVARDDSGEPADLVAWLPNDGWFGSWLDALPLLGMHALFAPRLGEPLPVFLDPLGWLQAGREGVVILDRTRARFSLEGVTVAAASVDDGLVLQKLLQPPKPKILVRAAADRIAA